MPLTPVLTPGSCPPSLPPLQLPNFRRSATLREKLLYAIKSGAGFELS